MDDKRFRVFAGPNGSGTTALVRQISEQYYIGYFMNADRVESE
jgi:predicted ABC-type ATPase